MGMLMSVLKQDDIFEKNYILSNTTFPTTALSSSMNTGMLLTGSMTVSWNGTLKEGLISWQLNIWDSVPLTAPSLVV